MRTRSFLISDAQNALLLQERDISLEKAAIRTDAIRLDEGLKAESYAIKYSKEAHPWALQEVEV